MTQATPAEIMRRLELAYEAAEAALESIQDETAQALVHYNGLRLAAEYETDPLIYEGLDARAETAYRDYQELRRQIGGYEKAAEEAFDKLEAGRDEERSEFERAHLRYDVFPCEA